MKENINLQNYTIFSDYKNGLKKGFPICLGYMSVSLTFGMMAVSGGLSPSIAVLISMTNLTSAGQFAGISLIFNTASYIELALTMIVINIRYMLMSLSLSQKTERDISIIKRCIISFGITDETFTVASLEREELSSQYMLGLITLPYIGWVFGTFIGSLTTSLLPIKLQDALGLALYAMFIALILPEIKKSKPIFIVVLISISLSCLFKYLPYLNRISYGFIIIISSIVASGTCAYFFPIDDK